jgi:N-acetylmuramoyl-L-alanine amidase
MMARVCIDPGHGGSSPGTSGHGLVEKVLNLEVSLELEKLLVNAGVEVVMTRRMDVNVSLKDRTDLANSRNCDLFVSVHHNGFDKPTACGIEVFHQIHNDKSKRLGRLVLRNLIDGLGLVSRGLKNRVNSSGGDWYHVLRESRMPAIISEAGFLTCPGDADKIKNGRFNGKTFVETEAFSIYKGVMDYLGIEEESKPFEDVDGDHWASEAVMEMKKLGIMIAMPDGKFNGSHNVSRYELAVTLRRLLRELNK